MDYLGDIAEDATIRNSFNTRNAAGAPITLTGSPTLAVYKDGNTTESTAGVTLSVDFDSRTGHHVFAIDTSADAFYATGSDYRIVITAGTVDGVSVVGSCVGTFSIQNRGGGGDATEAKQDEILEDVAEVQAELAEIAANLPAAKVDPLTRDVSDVVPIKFSWHAETPTPTVTVSIDGGAFVPIAGTVTPTLPDISGPGEYFFQISHDPADRPTAPGTAIYLMTDGIVTDYVILNVVEYSVSFGGDGDFSITIPVINETTSAAIAGARVTLLTEAGVTTSATATTGTSGIVVLRADPGDYLIAVTPPAGYSTPDNTEITVAADLVVPAIELAGSIIPPASDPAKTNLAVDVKDQHGSPVVGAIVSAVLHCDGKLIAGGMITNVERTFTTDVDGRAVVPVIRATQFDADGGEYEISVRTRGKTAKANYTAADLDADQLVVTIF